jgi:hypothetical protein
MIKENPMIKTNSFFSNFKHLGPIQIHLNKNSSTVVSILGVSTYNFKLLPQNCDNITTLLQLSFKAYLNENIDNFDNLEPMKKPKTNIFDFFSRLQIPLAIDTGCYKDKIKGAIMKDYKEFDWSNINSFDLVENCENITEACTPPVVNRLYNFKETLFFNSNIDEEVKNINTCNGSSVEELNKFIRVFIISEIKGFDKIKEDLKLLQAELGIDRKILDDLIKCHDCILGKIHCMICK